jgi:murein DD-endopeptidase MepM/ murein hydrolase activator NlpD
MERVLNADERIRRAEELYYRRKIKMGGKENTKVNVNYEKNDDSLIKKILLQVLICCAIYIIMYLIQTTNYVFSASVLNKTKEILSYDINITTIYKQSFNYINGIINKNEKKDEENKEENANANETEVQSQSNLEDSNTTQTNTENIGGEQTNVNENLSQMDQDARSILASKSLIVPLTGTITSRYGPRESSNPNVPKYHTGIDIAVNEGTTFIASMAGTVTMVSSQGDYRKSCNDCKRRCRNTICTLQDYIC